MQCESGDASIPPSSEALPLSDSAGQRGNRSLSAAGGQRPPTSSQMALACGTINLATSQTSRKQLASWQKGQGQWYCGTNHCNPCQILRSYFLRFGDAPSKYWKIWFISIYICTYKCIYIYIRTYKSNHGWFFNENTRRYLCCQSQPGFERYFNQSQSLGRTNRWQTIFLWSLSNMLLLKRLEERTLCILAGGWWYWLFITELAASDTHPEQVLTRQPKWPHYM